VYQFWQPGQSAEEAAAQAARRSPHRITCGLARASRLHERPGPQPPLVHHGVGGVLDACRPGRPPACANLFAGLTGWIRLLNDKLCPGL